MSLRCNQGAAWETFLQAILENAALFTRPIDARVDVGCKRASIGVHPVDRTDEVRLDGRVGIDVRRVHEIMIGG